MDEKNYGLSIRLRLAALIVLSLSLGVLLTGAAEETAHKNTLETMELRVESIERQRDAAEASAARWRDKYRAAQQEAWEAEHWAEEVSFALDDLRNEYTPWTQAGEFQIVHYCACAKCCGKHADGITATGSTATEGRTVAVDPAVIPLGSQVVIGGHTYIAEDTGVHGNMIDVFVNDHDEALRLGTYRAAVWWRN